ncbi:MAG: hypothetical protein HYY05_01985 [Chloroflexi bacterium]|nr:hypothetical protein [Chloroflexota bacterium]
MKANLLVGLATLLLYTSTLSRHYTPDTMAFARLAAQGPQPDSLFFQAEHLLYPALPWLAYRTLAAAEVAAPPGLGGLIGPLEVLQLFNAFAGALGVAAFHGLLVRLGLSRGRALAGALLLAGSYAFWYHATEGEDQIAANALLLLAAVALSRRSRCAVGNPFVASPSSGSGQALSNHGPSTSSGRTGRGTPSLLWPAAAAACVGLAILLHGTAVLFVPAALWLCWRTLGARAAALVCLVLGAVLAASYTTAGFVVHGITSLEGLLAWGLAAPRGGVWGTPSLTNLWVGLKGLARALLASAGEPQVRALVSGDLGALGGVLVFLLALAALLLLPILGLLRGLRAGREERSIRVPFALLWALPYGLFTIYWAPEDIQFWAGILPPLFLLGLHAVPAIARLWSMPVGLAAAAIPLALNGVLAMLPRSDAATNRELATARCIAGSTTDQDLIIAPGWDWAGSYLPYFGQRQVWSLLDHAVLQAGRDPQRLLALTRGAVADTQSRGGRVFLLRLPGLTEADAAFFRRVSGLRADGIDWPRRPAGQCDRETLWLLDALPPG